MRKNSGQIALVAVLIMTVLLTIGLAVITRSVTDIRISEETGESTRAFSAAEAGIEEALKHDLATLTWSEQPIPVGTLEAKVTVATTNSFTEIIEKNETAEVRLDGYAGDRLNVNWDGDGLELTLIYSLGGSYKIARWALKKVGTICGTMTDVTTPYTLDISSYSNPKVLRVRPICANATVTVSGVSGNPLPDQFYTIKSSTTIPDTGQTRAVEVKKSWPILPPIFDYVLFSGGGLVR